MKQLSVAGTALLLWLLPAAAAAQAGAEWTGTVTVDRRAAGSLKGGDTSVGFTARQTVTFSLNGDGTATWQSSFTSAMDMAGLYTIPSSGSGSGLAFASVGFNGQNWEIHVEPEDDLTVYTNYTDQDRVWADKSFLALFYAMAKAMGQPAPRPGTRIEEGGIGVPGASVPSRAASTATTLSGSVRDTVPGGADQMGGFGTIPATYTYSWNLTKGPARSHVKIYGPECGCLEADATEKTLRFIAGASPAGGEFSEFVVTSSGEAPRIDSNIGGEKASLEIAGTKDTGTVTLKIRYRRNGATTESAPLSVDFCAIDRIELEDGNEHDIAFDLDGNLTVKAKAKAWRGGRDISAELAWDIDRMGAPTSLTADPAEKKGDHVAFTYHGMPEENSEFGEKKLTARITGKCDCRQEEVVRTFYPDLDSNHPDDGTPNWFYYWKQTSAVPAAARGILEFRQTVTDPNTPGEAIARYDQQSQKILIGDALFGPKACRGEVGDDRAPTGRRDDGIDCFGNTVRHELQHRADAIAWWGGAGGPYEVNPLEWFLRDWDHDQVPNTVEESLPGCKPGEWTNTGIDLAKLLTLQDDLVARGRRTWFTCRQRPFDDVTDAEINAYRQGWTWPAGSANSEDWSCGELSKQWSGKTCGR